MSASADLHSGGPLADRSHALFVLMKKSQCMLFAARYARIVVVQLPAPFAWIGGEMMLSGTSSSVGMITSLGMNEGFASKPVPGAMSMGAAVRSGMQFGLRHFPPMQPKPLLPPAPELPPLPAPPVLPAAPPL